MSEDLAHSWRCPRCRGLLSAAGGGLDCSPCSVRYDVIGGIPDFRLELTAFAEDRERAIDLLEQIDGMTVAEAVRSEFASRPQFTVEKVDLRTARVMEGAEALRADVRGWLAETMAGGTPFLDVGCGPGQLLAAAAAEGLEGIGIDVSLVWLLIARKLIRERGGTPVLAAAQAEALPLADGCLGVVVSLDVIEHVTDQARYLEEIDRVLEPGGRLALATPNRFSLAAEPHVSVWGVGYLPRRLQSAYVRRRTGREYLIRLLSSAEIGRLLRRHTHLSCRIVTPPIPDEEMARFPRYRAQLARIYNATTRWPWTRPIWLRFGAFLRVLCRKP